MAEVHGSGFDLNRRGARSRFASPSSALALFGAVLASSLFVNAQAPARPPKKQTPPPAAVTVSVAPETTNAAPQGRSAPPASALLQMVPGRPPLVDWDGRLLTIDAENSTLSDVLLAVRSRTGASIEMPGSASAERIAIHVGPAPIRDVLSTLLYGTNFNYVIQASEDDQSGLGKVILISRDGSGDDDVIGVDAPVDQNVRLMPGYGAPGKRDFEVAHARAKRAAAENAAAAADSSNQDASPAPENDTASNPTPEPDSQPVASNNDSSNSSSTPSDATIAASGQPLSSTAAGIASAATASNAGDGPSISNMEQNLTKMYEQRRQISAQQKQPPQQTPPAP